MSLFLVLLAAGDGKRLKSRIPKAYNRINQKSLIEHSIDKFKEFKEIKKIFVVYNKSHKHHIKKLKLKKIVRVIGGKTRQKSTLNALKTIKKTGCKKVLIHDVARPNISKKLIKKIIDKLKNNHAVIPLINISDAIKIKKGNKIIGNINRKNLGLAQTPQGFTFKEIYKKHFFNKDKNIVDDSILYATANKKAIIVNGEKNNFKITVQQDLEKFKALNKGKILYGIGYDIHKLNKGRKLYLGGIKIPFKLGTMGHSDGDPVLHALVDSILGACKLGDIGNMFPDTNKKYKNIRSTKLLAKVVNLIIAKKIFINNIDINIIAQKPRIKKYKNKIVKSISKICNVEEKQINIKGKTTEKLGIIGKSEAIASEVITSLISYA